MQRPIYNITMKTCCSIYFANNGHSPNFFIPFTANYTSQRNYFPPVFNRFSRIFLSRLRFLPFGETLKHFQYIACKYLYLSFNQQKPVGRCRNSFQRRAKPCHQVMKPLSTTCKALSSGDETPFNDVKSPVISRWNPFQRREKPCHQVMRPLSTTCKALSSVDETPFNDVKCSFDKNYEVFQFSL